MAVNLFGVDVSSYNGNIDWQRAKAAGVKYAILRCHQKYGIEESFERNYKGCRENGIPAGVYKYSYALTEDGARAEARDVLEALRGKELALPVFYDLEDESVWGTGTDGVERIARAFLEAVAEAGFAPGIYCNMNWYSNRISAALKRDYPFWLASYPAPDSGAVVERIRPSAGIGWQYSERGQVDGIGQCDVNLFDASILGEAAGTATAITAEDVLDTARDWLGCNEADGSHRQIIDLYNAHKPLAQGYKVGYTDSWCDTFVSAVYIKLGAADLIGGTECGVERHVGLFKAAGIWYEDGTIVPDPGDIIVFNWDQSSQPNDGYADHIGIVESVRDGVIHTIEGNASGAVMRRTYKVGDGNIRGFARPAYGRRVQTEPQPQPQAPTISTTDRPLLVFGSSGKDVVEAQHLLNVHGADLDEDGYFGRLTRRAVIRYQNAFLLEETGAVDEGTWKSLLTRKTNKELARSVIRGLWGNWPERMEKLSKAGYDAQAVQRTVNALLEM